MASRKTASKKAKVKPKTKAAPMKRAEAAPAKKAKPAASGGKASRAEVERELRALIVAEGGRKDTELGTDWEAHGIDDEGVILELMQKLERNLKAKLDTYKYDDNYSALREDFPAPNELVNFVVKRLSSAGAAKSKAELEEDELVAAIEEEFD
jgi:hypothetical protein